jgi:hypothetical protein
VVVRSSLVLAVLVSAVPSCRSEVPATVPELGALSVPAVVTGRDGGAAAMVGGRMLWTFNDTLLNVFGADGFSYRSATAGWASGPSLLLDEALDANGAPLQLVPYTPEEIAFNRARGPDERFALWPDAVVPDEAGGALVFSAYLRLLPRALSWDRLGVSVAQLEKGALVARRRPGVLFGPPEPGFDTGAVVVDGLLYLYACDPPPGAPRGCPVARAPLSMASSHDAWKAWTGTAWSSDLASARPVVEDVPGELSVSWNAYLRSFLAVHSAPLSSDVVYRTAPAPEGPWSAERPLFTGRHDGTHTNYAAKEHPELARDGGRTLVVSYADAGQAAGARIRLALPALP